MKKPMIIIPLTAALILTACGQREQNPSADRPESTVAPTNSTAQSNSSPYRISVDEAKSTAFERVGVSEADVRDIDIDLERDRYEIDFEVSGIEYEIYINAYTGEIVRFESEPDRY